ncbi:MAG: hypothetical protein MHM6MM_000436 [Cercozoa sp. M6MM]
MLLLRRALSAQRRALACTADNLTYVRAMREDGHSVAQPLLKAEDSERRMVWIDCEMTGLEPERHRLVEIAVVVTDHNLHTIASLDGIAIHQPKEVLQDMNDWCQKTFKKNGLLERIKASKLTTAEVERQVIDFLAQHVPVGWAPLCGNSIHQDRLFLRNEMPGLNEFLHYQIVDVSSIRNVGKRWLPLLTRQSPSKSNSHLALDDIRESIEELRFYRSALFTREDSAEAPVALVARGNNRRKHLERMAKLSSKSKSVELPKDLELSDAPLDMNSDLNELEHRMDADVAEAGVSEDEQQCAY